LGETGYKQTKTIFEKILNASLLENEKSVLGSNVGKRIFKVLSTIDGLS